MSTRAGRVVYLDDMMDQIVDASLERLKEVDMSDNQKQLLSEKIGIGSLRYNVLKVQPEKGFTFSIDDALSIQGDSAPFAMYSHARMSSILRRYGASIPDLNQIILLACIGPVVIVSHFLFIKAYQFAEASVLAPIHYFEIVSNALISILFFKDIPSILVTFGILCIISSGVLISLNQK